MMDETHPVFSYSIVGNLPADEELVEPISDYTFSYYGRLGAFTYIQANRDKCPHYNSEALNRGWKFHIAIDDGIEGNIEQAWSTILKYIIKHQICVSKVLREEDRESFAQDPEQCGKEVTIYAFYENKTPEQWQAFIQETTAELTQREISPGPLPPSDKPIQGSVYFSYRNDEEDPKKWAPDIFADIEIHVDNQLTKKVFSSQKLVFSTDGRN